MVAAWEFHDASVPETYTFPTNPDRMQPLHGSKTINTSMTTAVDGKTLVTQGNTAPFGWGFSGNVYTEAEYEALRSWVEDRNIRIRVTDHFGRQFWVVLTEFSPEPVYAYGRYWKHTYEIKATVLTKPTAPTVGV